MAFPGAVFCPSASSGLQEPVLSSAPGEVAEVMGRESVPLATLEGWSHDFIVSLLSVFLI